MDRYVVFLKQVPGSTKVEMDTETKTLKRASASTQVNPDDLYALQAALDLRNRRGSGEVVAVSMGPSTARSVLQEALQRGADRAVLLSSRAFAGSDTWCTSRVLAAAVRKLGAYTLLFFGRMAVDGDTAQVGPEVAAHLGIPQVAPLLWADALGEHSLVLDRRLCGGRQRLEVQYPCALMVSKDWGHLDSPTLEGWRRAQSVPVVCWNEDDLGLDASEVGLLASPTRVVSTEVPEVRKQIRWMDTPEALCECMNTICRM